MISPIAIGKASEQFSCSKALAGAEWSRQYYDITARQLVDNWNDPVSHDTILA
jgi:hypothetical protein